MPHPSSRVERTCEHCSAVFTVPASRVKFGPARFCSTECKFASWKAGTLKPPQRVERTCAQCGRVSQVVPSKAHSRFCSQACMILWRDSSERSGARARVGKVGLKCEWCGVGMQRYPSQISAGRGRFCSRECNGAWGVRQQGRESQLERDFAQLLRDHGLIFDTQAQFRRYCLDIAFPASKLAVEVDGDYWHSLPNVKAKDRRKDAALLAAGWRVLHVPEHRIRSAPQEAVQSVLDALA